MVGIGIVELVVLLVVAVVIVRSPHPARTSIWLGLVMLALASVNVGYARHERSRSLAAQEQMVSSQMSGIAIHAQARPEMHASMTVGPTHWGDSHISQRSLAWGRLALLVTTCLAVFGIVRGRSGGAASFWTIPGCILLVVAASWFMVRLRSAPSPAYVWSAPAEILPDQQMADMPEEPIDELYERLSQPEIQLTAEAPDEPSPPEHAADEAHDVATAEAEEHAQESAQADSSAIGESEDWGEESGDSPAPASGAASIAMAGHEDPSPEPARTRPDWVVNPPKLVTGQVRRYVVQAGPYVTLDECYAKLRDQMRHVVEQRVADLAKEATGQTHIYSPPLEWMRLSNDFIVRELLTDDFVEITESESLGEMRTAWGLLEFTDAQDQRLLDGWKRYARREGIAITASISAVVLSLLGGVLALLKIDTWTRGYYTKRLFLGVPAAIIGVIFLLVLANS